MQNGAMRAWLLVLLCFVPGETLRQPEVVPTLFKNVLLVVHCRLNWQVEWESICKQRKPLYSGYRKYFPEVIYMTHEHCVFPGDPYRCLIQYMEGRGSHRDGIFYMHFDALIRPHTLAHIFDPLAIGSFSMPKECDVNPGNLSLMTTYPRDFTMKSCFFASWDRHSHKYAQAIDEIVGTPEVPLQIRTAVTRHKVYLANDDLFYVPQKVFKGWAQLSKVLSKYEQHHETAGPTIRSFLARAYDVEHQDLGCTGGCCEVLDARITLRQDFRCGHRFDLRDSTTRHAFRREDPATARLTLEATPSFAQLIEEALA